MENNYKKLIKPNPITRELNYNKNFTQFSIQFKYLRSTKMHRLHRSIELRIENQRFHSDMIEYFSNTI